MSKWYKSREFKEIEEEWYKKLKDTGFQDIEYMKRGEQQLAQSCLNVYYQQNSISVDNKTSYFTAIRDKINEEPWNNQLHKLILSFHAEGVSKVETVKILKSQFNISIHRQTVMFIVRRYVHKWGIRFFTKEQMYSFREIPKDASNV